VGGRLNIGDDEASSSGASPEPYPLEQLTAIKHRLQARQAQLKAAATRRAASKTLARRSGKRQHQRRHAIAARWQRRQNGSLAGCGNSEER